MKSGGSPSRPILLTIAGFDPSSGAGIAADLKVFAAHRMYGISAITALTVQSTQGVRRTEPVSPDLLKETLQCLVEDMQIDGVKIGMLGTAANVRVVSRFLENSGLPPGRIVLDPVIRSSSGKELLDPSGLDLLRTELLARAGWVTPNIQELAILLERPVSGTSEIPRAAADLQSQHAALRSRLDPPAAPDSGLERPPNSHSGLKEPRSGLNIVVTGGESDPPNDFLRSAAGDEFWFPGERIETSATHGTGCTFSSALLSALVAGESPAEAVKAAKNYVALAMRKAYRIGKGNGPLHHLFDQEVSR